MTDEWDEAAQRNDMGRAIANAIASQGYNNFATERDGLAFLRELEEQGYTLRLTTDEERAERRERRYVNNP